MARFHTNGLCNIYYERLGYLADGDELYAAFDGQGGFLAVNSLSLADVRHLRGGYDEFWDHNHRETSDVPFSLDHTGVPGAALYRGTPFHQVNFRPMTEPQPQQQRELVAYVKFFTNARGQLAVAAALTPDALHRANMVEPANELKRLKIKTTV